MNPYLVWLYLLNTVGPLIYHPVGQGNNVVSVPSAILHGASFAVEGDGGDGDGGDAEAVDGIPIEPLQTPDPPIDTLTLTDDSDPHANDCHVDSFLQESAGPCMIKVMSSDEFWSNIPCDRAQTDQSEPNLCNTWWKQRAEVVAKMIPKNTVLLDIGCGCSEITEFLDPSVTYIASDIVVRPNVKYTYVCNFNQGQLPNVKNVTMISLLGVSPYSCNLEVFMSAIRTYDVPVIMTYIPSDFRHGNEMGSQFDVNEATQRQLEAAIVSAGFKIVSEVQLNGLMAFPTLALVLEPTDVQ